MDQNELTSIYCQRPESFAWFLGAGASRTSGLPTATDIIWYLKRRYYCQEENQDISRQDIQNDAVKARIQQFMDSKGFPEQWASQEYSVYFEKIFGADRERQQNFLNGILSEDKVQLSVGNRVFGALIASNFCRVAFTTNFDSVVEKAVAEVSGQSLSAFHIEGSTAANNALNNESYPLYCKLHGDFRYDSVKNLSADLATQNKELSDCLVNAGNRFGFIVAGYSGRDESVMELFHAVLETNNPFPHGLYWTGIRGTNVPPQVVKLIDAAKAKGVSAEYIEIETFDALLLRLWRNVNNKPPKIDQKVQRHQASSTHIPLASVGSKSPIMRLNALPIIRWPNMCSKLSFKSVKEWKDLRDAQRNTEGKLILTKSDSVWGWGSESDFREGFGKDLLSIEPFELSQKVSSLSENLHFKSFFEEALCIGLARGKPLLARSTKSSSFLIVDAHSDKLSQLDSLFHAAGKLHGEIPGLFTRATSEYPKADKVTWAEAIRVSVEIKDGKFWLLLDPDIWIWPTRERRSAIAFMDKRRGGRLNKKYNELLDGWVRGILGTNDRNSEVTISTFDNGSDVENPSFKLGTRTAFSRRLIS